MDNTVSNQNAGVNEPEANSNAPTGTGQAVGNANANAGAPIGATAAPQSGSASGGAPEIENYVSVADEYQIDGKDPAPPREPARANQAPSIIAPSVPSPDATARPQSPTPSTSAPKI